MSEYDNVKRFDRIVAILIQLQTKKIVKAQELADRFGISLRTVYRDIRTLESSGVPILGEAGVGYSIMEGYRLPPIMFTKEEAVSFVAAEKLMEQFADDSLGSYFASAMYKIKSVLRSFEKSWMDAIESQVSIDRVDLFNKNVPNALEIIFESIAEKQQIFLRYEALHAESETSRLVEPIGLFYEWNYWYMLAYCHLRNDYRQFRADRIIQIRSTQTPFVYKHGILDDYRKTETQATDNTKVVILADKKVSRYMRSNGNYHRLVAEEIKDDKVKMTFMPPDLENGFARWFLMFADSATVLEPESLKLRLRELMAEASSRL